MVRAGDRARAQLRRRGSSASVDLDDLIAWNADRHAGQEARAELARRRRNAARRAATAARNASGG